jgi:geranylgeranyl diphosphate synthase type II
MVAVSQAAASSRPPADAAVGADVVPRLLEEYGQMTRAALRPYLPKGDGPKYLYDLLADYPTRGGKMMRSTLCIATACAFGAPIEDVIPSAVAIELLHNSFLVHDDIQDASDERRGRPTLHKLHGIPLAMNAGESLSLLSLQPLKANVRRLGSQLAARIFEETERVAWESAEGQALELGWRRDNRMDIDDEDYLVMVLKKTCWLGTIHPCRVGALIGARGPGGDQLDALIPFGFFLGAAFQIQDDVLNLMGGEGYGKEANGDLWEGKRTLMLGHVYRTSSAGDRQRLEGMLSVDRAERRAEDVAWARRLMDERGSLEYASKVARGLAGAALHEFDRVFGGLPESDETAFIQGLARWVLDRTN